MVKIKNIVFISFFFLNLENARKNVLKTANFFYILYKEKMLPDKIKVRINDGREAPLGLNKL